MKNRLENKEIKNKTAKKIKKSQKIVKSEKSAKKQ